MSVTVVIPSYNHRPYVLQAIESVLAQELTDLDLIVIDDGSRDGSAELIRELWEKRGGFRFIARENRGLIRTLNEGLDLAEADVFCLLASDDYLPPGSLSVRAEFLLTHPEHVAVFGDGLVLVEATGASERILDAKRRRLFELADPIPEFLKGVNLPIHTMLARTEVLRRLGGIDRRYRRCEDLELQPRLFLEGAVGFVDQPVYCYRRHETNISGVNPQIARIDKVLCFRKFLTEIPEMIPYRRLIRQRLRRHYLQLGRYLADKGGGEAWEQEIFRLGWEFWWQDPRLLWYLLRWGSSAMR